MMFGKSAKLLAGAKVIMALVVAGLQASIGNQ